MRERKPPDDADPDPSPQPAGDPVGPLDSFAGRNRSRHVERARRLLRQLGVGEAVLSAEGAVNEAWIRLCKWENGRRFLPITTQDGCDRILSRILERVIVDTGRRQKAGKRKSPGPEIRDAELLERIRSRAARPDDQLGAEEYAEWLLAALGDGKTGERLRQVVLMRVNGLSNEEIAAELGLEDVRSVERKFQQIRSLLGPYLEPHE